MDRHIRLDTIAEKLEALCRQDGPVSGQAAQVLSEAVDELHAFQRENLDFHEIVEHVDHSIFVTDGEGNVLYVNPAYSQNTNVQPEDVLGRNVFDIVQEGRIFTGGASCDVIQNRKRVFRLSTTYKTDPPLMGYTVGVPVFNRDGSLSKVVVSSRPLSTLKLLQGDFEQFLHNLEEIRKREPVSSVNENSSTLEARPMIGHSKALNGIWEKIRHVAASDATVLITGESGVGKEVVADEVYRHSLRNNRPYIKVNCAAIPASLLESELFGYDKGAFSGASAGGKAGLFELADGGTIFLDEIGEMPPEAQVSLLRLLQNHETSRLGGKSSRRIDVRVLAATNRNLPQAIKEGKFREDLYYRLNVMVISVPPLRDRPEDIAPLAEHFLRKAGISRKTAQDFSSEAWRLLRHYAWPGNARELENVVERALHIATAPLIQASDLPPELEYDPSEAAPACARRPVQAATLRAHESEFLLATRRRGRGNIRAAAKELNISRSALYAKLARFGINYREFRQKT